MNWDDLRLFLAVARAQGLAGARAATGSSAPTLGRRMHSLERVLGAVLFERRRDGYILTAAGRELLDRARALEQGALAIERWSASLDPQPVVRIAAGPWTSTFLARHAALIAGEAARIEILTDAGLADLSRREANLGIRNQRPQLTGLAGRRLGRVAFAIYGRPGFLSSVPQGEDRFANCDWLVLSSAPSVPSVRWLDQHLRRPARLTCSMAAALLEAARAGARAVRAALFHWRP